MKKLLLFVLFNVFIFEVSNSQSKLLFSYDTAGNQNQRFYCEVGPCNPPIPSAKSDEIIKEITKSDNANTIDNNDFSDSHINMYPNPTNNSVFISFQNSPLSSIKQLKVFNVYSTLVKTISINKDVSNLEFDLSNQSAGVYFFVFIKTDWTTY
ncbi:T9SS type A sorting domain-containing protein [Lutibacter sp.]|uniref:T9SS type A sorting domain-containing protein n=1 Tax=Lutibacter sp. TaxID=1925666 RepID=UPI0025BC6C3A|nr:T9SS type A sorting domain-containing protein [Lutibacter sp.]MCF6182719.1 T9SS type A sorting domain-containing protein [Lutibacter sp.]